MSKLLDKRPHSPLPTTDQSSAPESPENAYRHPKFVAIDTLTSASYACRVTPGYLDKDNTGKPAGYTLTKLQREKVVKYINELAEDFQLHVQTGSFAINYFDRWCTHDCIQKHARQERIDTAGKHTRRR